LRNYEFILGNLQEHFGDIDLSAITSEDIIDFMSKVTNGTSQNTKNYVSPSYLLFSILSKIPLIPKSQIHVTIQHCADFSGLENLPSSRYLRKMQCMLTPKS
jgi:hypothetical protein